MFPTTPVVVFIAKISNLHVRIVIEPLEFKFRSQTFSADKTCFSKIVVNSSLLRIFAYRFLRWKLDFWGYNLDSRISSFGLEKPEIISFEVDPS